MKTTPPNDDVKKTEAEAKRVTEEERMDEAMAESFPASDPPSWTAGVKQEEDELTEDSRES